MRSGCTSAHRARIARWIESRRNMRKIWRRRFRACGRTGIEDLRTDLRGWLQQVAQNDDDWKPLHFEFALRAGGASGPRSSQHSEEAVLTEGVRLRGSIDLVEKHVATRRAAGDGSQDREASREDSGVYGRRASAAAAALRAGGGAAVRANVESGRLFYATQRGGYQQIGIR